MRAVAVLVGVFLLAGCTGGPTHATLAPLPTDFTVTQPAAAGEVVEATYVLNVTTATRLNATLVWGTAGNRLDLDLTAGGSGGQQGTVVGTVSRLEWTLYPATYVLKVSGRPVAADTWHLEAHFTRG
ncbi:MAG: hypothetical protein QOI63_1367 [Thermoplasmata archaeon]|jgi:hypothetical protein|nr:hypothetical protein [Thermoplasmata archaeon]